jgi:hypothetical protein
MDKHFVLIYDCIWSKLHEFFTSLPFYLLTLTYHIWDEGVLLSDGGWGSITTMWPLISRSNWFLCAFSCPRSNLFLSFDIDLWYSFISKIINIYQKIKKLLSWYENVPKSQLFDIKIKGHMVIMMIHPSLCAGSTPLYQIA